MLEHSFQDRRHQTFCATIVLSFMILFAALSSSAAVAEPGDFEPHFKTVFIDGNPSSDEVVTVMMRENGDDPRRTIKQLVPDEITIDGDYFASMSKGYIVEIDIGHITVAGEHGLNVTEARQEGEDPPKPPLPEASERAPFSYTVNTADLPQGIRDGMMDACTTPGPANFDFPIAMQVKAYRYKRGNTSANKRRDNTVFGTMPIKVICQLETQREEAPEPFSVDVLVNPQGETCPKKTDVTAVIKYFQPVTARFRFKVDGEPSEWITIKARKVGGEARPNSPIPPKPVYLIERLKTYHLDPGQHHFRVELAGGKQSDVKTLRIECPPFKVTSLWLTYKVEDKDTCPKKVVEKVTGKATRPGTAPFEIKTQGGLVVHSGTATFKRKGMAYVAEFGRNNLSLSEFESDMMALIKDQPSANSGWVPLKVDCLEVLSGNLTLNSLGDTSCKGEALVAIHTDGAGKLPYELECGPGKSWQRKVTAMANKIGVDKVRFDVTNNEQVTCVLRTRIGGVLKPLDGASKTFQCHKPTDTGTSDLAPDTRPEDPPVLDTLTGDFSFVDIGGTRCPRHGKALINFKTSKPDNVHYSLDCTNGHFSGVAQTAPAQGGGFVAPALVSFDVNQTTHANCVLKTVAPGKPKVHTLKGHSFQCVNRTDVGGPEDLAPDTRPDPQTPGTAVVDPVRPTISCANGAVKNGACECEPNFKPVKAGKNAWRCVRSTVDPKPEKPTVSEPKISCANGVVKNGGCTCARTHKPVKAGKNAWRCVKVVVDPKPNKDSANKLELKTAPKKTAQPKPGNAEKGNGGKGKGKTAKTGNGSSALR